VLNTDISTSPPLQGSDSQDGSDTYDSGRAYSKAWVSLALWYEMLDVYAIFVSGIGVCVLLVVQMWSFAVDLCGFCVGLRK